eukprot:TRINITY_DN17916_c0_g1_i1.p1 TRINITY_DN17916_c0_g1~~TRINITY_DN17916_c0_g1_i1.p1  ORF type:complete len:115 (+),score=12.59 TRINITY_DN17916_c0_g1_i1:157-501(+)
MNGHVDSTPEYTLPAPREHVQQAPEVRRRPSCDYSVQQLSLMLYCSAVVLLVLDAVLALAAGAEAEGLWYLAVFDAPPRTCKGSMKYLWLAPAVVMSSALCVAMPMKSSLIMAL